MIALCEITAAAGLQSGSKTVIASNAAATSRGQTSGAQTQTSRRQQHQQQQQTICTVMCETTVEDRMSMMPFGGNNQAGARGRGCDHNQYFIYDWQPIGTAEKLDDQWGRGTYYLSLVFSLFDPSVLSVSSESSEGGA